MLKNVTKPVQIVAERAEAQDDTQELVPERGAVHVVWEYFGFEKTPRRANRSPPQNVAAARGNTSHSLRHPTWCNVMVSAVPVATLLQLHRQTNNHPLSH